MPTAIHKKIRQCEAGELPSAILRLKSGWVVAGDVQPLQGYCILMADPVAADFNALSEEARAQYALDMGRVGDALLKVRGAHRINYETWGNQDPALHTHIVPRFLSEPPVLRVQTPRQAYDWASGRPFSTALDSGWMAAVREYLQSRN
jgi:diadenosine tetraphosphate (Ap4A) HIT family hydrolase